MFQSNPSCGRARNNYTRKMSFSSPFSPSVFNSVFISPPPWRSTLFSFLSYFLPLLFALLSSSFLCSASVSSPPLPLLSSVTVSLSALFPYSSLSSQPLNPLLSTHAAKCFSPRLETYLWSKQRGMEAGRRWCYCCFRWLTAVGWRRVV